jgi:hypothetical protein
MTNVIPPLPGTSGNFSIGRLADVAAGSLLQSGGVSTHPSYTSTLGTP